MFIPKQILWVLILGPEAPRQPCAERLRKEIAASWCLELRPKHLKVLQYLTLVAPNAGSSKEGCGLPMTTKVLA